MDSNSIERFAEWTGAGIVALCVAAWRLSHIWTRMETKLSEATKAIARIEDTVHGSDLKNGIKSQVGKISIQIEGIDARLVMVERRLNTKDRRVITRRHTTDKRPGGG